jgi:hypothetical protein
MGSEQDMVDSARRATGDDILVAGLFAPLGDAASIGFGDATDATSSGVDVRRAKRISSLVGFGAAPATAEPRARQLRLVVAVSPTRVYLLRTMGTDDSVDERYSLAHTFDRRRVAATIHACLSARTLTLEDTWTGERFELEAERTPGAHVTATMHALSDIHELAS